LLHDRVEDGWVSYRGRVLDVSKFLNEHPGGASVVEPFLGRDIEQAFDDVGHSKAAVRMMDEFCIGYLKGHVRQECVISECPTKHKGNGEFQELFSSHGVEVHSTLNKSQHGVDFSQPLVPQIYKITGKQYVELLKEPYCSTQVSTFFQWTWLEPLSRTQWWVVPLIWIPVSMYLLFSAIDSFQSVKIGLLLYIVGIFAWTFFEYTLHRFVFHFVEDRLPDHGVARVCHFLMHAVHHLFPLDPLRLVMPPALLAVMCCPFWFVFEALLPTLVIRGIWSGVFTGYIAYDMIHYHSHHSAFQNIPYLNEIKRYHMKHHFKQPEMGFGVSNKLWDWVFGTLLS